MLPPPPSQLSHSKEHRHACQAQFKHGSAAMPLPSHCSTCLELDVHGGAISMHAHQAARTAHTPGATRLQEAALLGVPLLLLKEVPSAGVLVQAQQAGAWQGEGRGGNATQSTVNRLHGQLEHKLSSQQAEHSPCGVVRDARAGTHLLALCFSRLLCGTPASHESAKSARQAEPPSTIRVQLCAHPHAAKVSIKPAAQTFAPKMSPAAGSVRSTASRLSSSITAEMASLRHSSSLMTACKEFRVGHKWVPGAGCWRIFCSQKHA